MPIIAAIRLTTHLNALAHGAVSVDVAAHTIASDGRVHHVIDESGVLGLDPLHATPLAEALPAALLFDQGGDGWQLALPSPGRLASLRGPAPFTAAALDAGATVIPNAGGAAWVPQIVGSGVQWHISRATPPAAPPGRYEAERRLNECVLAAARSLDGLGMPGGQRPDVRPVPLAAGYSARHLEAANRALLLLAAAETALDDDAHVLSSHALQSRSAVLRDLDAAARESLTAACSWPS